jgi:hypothetical protein
MASATRTCVSLSRPTIGQRLALRLAPADLKLQFKPAIGGIRHLQLDCKQPESGVKVGPATKTARGQSKIYKNADEAVADLKSGSTILSAGFGLCGTAGKMIDKV